jgi:nucleotidyltransferase/DNA polymerase involved in DNA repair
MDFTLRGPIREIETIASGAAVRTRRYLWRRFGRDHWRKMKGVAEVRYPDGSVWLAELHWYEAHGIGKRLLKVKRQLHRL